MANFRVKVNLSEFYDDIRQEAYIFLKKEWTNVQCVQDHIATLFNLRNNRIFLTVSDIFLPALENILIIKPNETIKVLSSPKLKTVEKEIGQFDIPNSNSTILDSCNLPALFFSNDTPIKNPLIRRTIENGGGDHRKVSFVVKEKVVENEEEEIPENGSKKKRKRIRKRKNKKNETSHTEITAPDNSKVNRNNNKTVTLKASHVRYQSTSSSEEEEETEQPSKRILCYKTIKNHTSRIIEPFVEQNVSTIDSEHEEVDETVNDQNSIMAQICESDVNNVPNSVQTDAETTGDYKNTNSVTNHSINLENSTAFETIRNKMDQYSVLKEIPKKNDVIGFKVLRMTENYVPEVSEFIVGMIESVEEDNLEIFILAGNDELKSNEGGKFSMPDCDDTIVDMDDGILRVKWNELSDVRLIDK